LIKLKSGCSELNLITKVNLHCRPCVC